MLMFREMPGPAQPQGEAQALRLRDLWATIVRHRWLVAAVAFVVVATAVAITRLQPPVYVGTATLRIDDPHKNQEVLGDMVPFSGFGNGNRIETEMLVLASRQIAEAVVDSLSMQVQVVQPHRPRAALFTQVQATRASGHGEWTLDWNAHARAYEVKPEHDSPRGPGRVQPGVPFSLAGTTLTLASSLRAAPVSGIRLRIRSFRDAVGALQAKLLVSRVNREADIVSIRFDSNDQEMAAAVPNVAAESFVAYKTRGAKTESRSTVEFLRGQVANYERQLSDAEARLKDFRESARIVNPEEQASEQVKRLADLQAHRDALRLERESLGRALVQARGATGTDQAFSRYRELAAFPTFLGNSAVQDVLHSLTDFENRRAELLLTRQEASPEVQTVEGRIRELQDGLYRTAQSYAQSLDNQIAGLDASLGQFGQQLETIPAREIEYARLQRQQKLLEQIYTLLQTRLKESEITEAVEPGDVRVVDSALVPDRPSSPRPFRNLGLAMVVGLFLGCAAAFARESLDTKVRSLEDAQAATAGLPMLGSIPRIPAPATNGNGRKHGPVVAVPPDALLSDAVITRRDPHSPVSEAYRALRTSVTFAGVERPPQLVVVTSAMPGDGKTTSASNLAVTLAQQGMRTLLVDADLRRGLLNKLFGVNGEPGLTNVLHMGTPLEEAVQQVSAGASGTPLDFLSSGPLPPNPAEILGSERMRALLREMRSRYDAVIFDAPPLNLVTDAALLGKAVDTTILVARSNVTDQRALRHAAQQLHFLQVPVAGVVLNDVDTSAASYYGYGKYGYYGN